MAKNVVQDDTLELAKNLQPGEILLLENLRYNAGETKNDEEFAKKLASMADRITSYNVCYTKLLRVAACLERPVLTERSAGQTAPSSVPPNAAAVRRRGDRCSWPLGCGS